MTTSKPPPPRPPGGSPDLRVLPDVARPGGASLGKAEGQVEGHVEGKDAQTPRTSPRAPSKGPVLGKGVRSDNLRPPDPDGLRLPRSTRNILSREEIDALLRPEGLTAPHKPAQTDPLPIESLDPATSAPATAPLLPRAQRLAARLSHAFQSEDGVAITVDVARAAWAPFRDCLNRSDTEGLFVCISDTAGHVGAVFGIPAAAGSAIIEKALGAGDMLAVSASPRRLTRLDRHLLEAAVDPLLAIAPTLGSLRTYGTVDRARATLPPGDAVVMTLNLRLGTRVWPATFAMDKAAFEAMTPPPQGVPANDITAGNAPAPSQPALPAPDKPPQGALALDAATRALTTLITAEVASLSVPLSKIAALKPGKTLLLGLPPGQPVKLRSGGRGGTVIGEGALGGKGDRMAVRLTNKSAAFK